MANRPEAPVARIEEPDREQILDFYEPEEAAPGGVEMLHGDAARRLEQIGGGLAARLRYRLPASGASSAAS